MASLFKVFYRFIEIYCYDSFKKKKEDDNSMQHMLVSYDIGTSKAPEITDTEANSLLN